MDSQVIKWLIVYALGMLCLLLVFTNIGNEFLVDIYHKDDKKADEEKDELNDPH